MYSHNASHNVIPVYQRPTVQVPQPLNFAEIAYDVKIEVQSMLYRPRNRITLKKGLISKTFPSLVAG